MGFDQKALKLVGKNVEVKMFNGLVISGKMSHVSKGYVCFITMPKAENETEVEAAKAKKPGFRRLALKDITSMVSLEG
ncbi:hypothetical protein [Brevibacillus dissolubilis]|uniref:hypothetical protein n=1 Tax=Brevibacillus dissolubilis TaxID=1844116 RepID=UPI0011176795|nr:hypothetical protein [Brevibacillus dissolubilis]